MAPVTFYTIDHKGLTSGIVCGIIVIEPKIGVERLFNKAQNGG